MTLSSDQVQKTPKPNYLNWGSHTNHTGHHHIASQAKHIAGWAIHQQTSNALTDGWAASRWLGRPQPQSQSCLGQSYSQLGKSYSQVGPSAGWANPASDCAPILHLAGPILQPAGKIPAAILVNLKAGLFNLTVSWDIFTAGYPRAEPNQSKREQGHGVDLYEPGAGYQCYTF